MKYSWNKLVKPGMLCAALLWTAPAFAEAPAGGEPHPVAENADDAPDASVAPRNWLKTNKRQTEASGSEESSGQSWPITALVLLSALGGAAIFMRYKKGAPTFLISQSDVRVVSTTRLSPKANLVVAEVHGRPLLLGVTEHAVSELGWLDLPTAPPNGNAEEEFFNRERDSQVGRAPGRFGDALASSMNRNNEESRETFRGNPNVAALIAANAPSDTVYTRKSAGRTSMRAVQPEQPAARVEDQVAGLMRRRR